MENSLKPKIEALLFVSDKPLKLKDFLLCLGDESGLNEKKLESLISELNLEYQSGDKPFFIKKVAGGYRYYVHDQYFSFIEPLLAEKRKGKLSQKALETLAIIAFKQPITKSEIEAIRGVNVDGVVRTLMERNLIKVAGRAQAPGNPLLYETTEAFLEYFGINSLEDLPKLKEIDEILESDNQIKKEIGEVVLRELLPEKLGLQIEPAELKKPDENGNNNDNHLEDNKDTTSSPEVNPEEDKEEK
jgi:segregation and condensation protein B